MVTDLPIPPPLDEAEAEGNPELLAAMYALEIEVDPMMLFRIQREAMVSFRQVVVASGFVIYTQLGTDVKKRWEIEKADIVGIPPFCPQVIRVWCLATRMPGYGSDSPPPATPAESVTQADPAGPDTPSFGGTTTSSTEDAGWPGTGPMPA